MMHIKNYKPKEFAELLNVSVKTLQRWDRDKVLISKRTPTNRRYYTYDQYLEFNGIQRSTDEKIDTLIVTKENILIKFGCKWFKIIDKSKEEFIQDIMLILEKYKTQALDDDFNNKEIIRNLKKSFIEENGRKKNE